MKTVWIYEEGRDAEHMFDSEEEAQAWFKKHDPEGVAFEYDVSELRPAGTADKYGIPKAQE
jgi:hypothetical protein